tara:strand:- start:8 stop:415 length:408 start_codon:yes stop_codon:yes gene_type:complete
VYIIDLKKFDAFSVNEKYWSQDDDVVTDYCEEHLNPGDEFSFWAGVSKQITNDQLISDFCLESIVESMQENLYDEIGEAADGYLDMLSTQENCATFKKLVSDFINSKEGSCGYFKVEEIKEFKAVWDGENYTVKD